MIAVYDMHLQSLFVFVGERRYIVWYKRGFLFCTSSTTVICLSIESYLCMLFVTYAFHILSWCKLESCVHGGFQLFILYIINFNNVVTSRCPAVCSVGHDMVEHNLWVSWLWLLFSSWCIMIWVAYQWPCMMYSMACTAVRHVSLISAASSNQCCLLTSK